MSDSHPALESPSLWVRRFAPLIRAGGRCLDVAAGGGRHSRHLAGLGLQVEAVDRDGAALARLTALANVTFRIADLEAGAWPYGAGEFDGVIVTNYLFRPLFPHLIAALARGGILIYETFAVGNEQYGRPSNPDFLLRPGELLEVSRSPLRVIAYEDLYVDDPKPAMVQRICARLA